MNSIDTRSIPHTQLCSLDPNIRLPPRRTSHGNTPCTQPVIHANLMDKPPSKGTPDIALWRLKQHQLSLASPRCRVNATVLVITNAIVHDAITSYKHNLVVFAVRIGRQASHRRPLLPIAPLSDEAAYLALEIHQKALCATRMLELVAQLLGHNALGCVVRGCFLAGGVWSEGGCFARGGLAGEARVPERGEGVGHGLGGVRGVDFPVAGERGRGVGVMEETICEGWGCQGRLFVNTDGAK